MYNISITEYIDMSDFTTKTCEAIPKDALIILNEKNNHTCGKIYKMLRTSGFMPERKNLISLHAV